MRAHSPLRRFSAAPPTIARQRARRCGATARGAGGAAVATVARTLRSVARARPAARVCPRSRGASATPSPPGRDERLAAIAARATARRHGTCRKSVLTVGRFVLDSCSAGARHVGARNAWRDDDAAATFCNTEIARCGCMLTNSRIERFHNSKLTISSEFHHYCACQKKRDRQYCDTAIQWSKSRFSACLSTLTFAFCETHRTSASQRRSPVRALPRTDENIHYLALHSE